MWLTWATCRLIGKSIVFKEFVQVKSNEAPNLCIAVPHPRVTGIWTHWGRDIIAVISQTTFSNAFSWMKNFVFWFEFHWGLFLRVQSTIIQHWFRKWFGADQATSHYLNHCWLSSMTHICGTRERWVNEVPIKRKLFPCVVSPLGYKWHLLGNHVSLESPYEEHVFKNITKIKMTIAQQHVNHGLFARNAVDRVIFVLN